MSDRLLVDVQYAHVGNNFTLGFHSPELRDVELPQRARENRRGGSR